MHFWLVELIIEALCNTMCFWTESAGLVRLFERTGINGIQFLGTLVIILYFSGLSSSPCVTFNSGRTSLLLRVTNDRTPRSTRQNKYDIFSPSPKQDWLFHLSTFSLLQLRYQLKHCLLLVEKRNTARNVPVLYS